jgi:transposase-like protein
MGLVGVGLQVEFMGRVLTEPRDVLGRQHEPAGDADLTVSERARLKELERRNRELEMENLFLKKAAAYFAKDAR